MKSLIVTLLVASLVAISYQAQWAVIVAGSNGFWNYRHQADVCHAYQTLLNKGFDASKIIVLSYNDVAKSSENPFPNTLFNKPTNGTGTDVNKNCKIDYELDDVNPTIFLAVLKGDAAGVKGKGSGRVLQSTAADYVFINFADHGAPGLIAFPSQYLYAKDLVAAFDYMHKNNMYKQLTFYLEACESGSMFQNLPKNTNIYAVSAASPDESSWGTYCPPDDDVVNGKHIGSCLGDLFSVNWMEDTDASDVTKETLQEQYLKVKKTTDKSQVMQWGQVDFTGETVGTFIGSKAASQQKKQTLWQRIVSKIKNVINKFKPTPKPQYRKIDSRDAKLVYLQAKYTANPTTENHEALQAELQQHVFFQNKFEKIALKFGVMDTFTGERNAITTVQNYDCLQKSMEMMESHCGKLSESALRYVKVLVDVCERTNHITDGIVDDIKNICLSS